MTQSFFDDRPTECMVEMGQYEQYHFEQFEHIEHNFYEMENNIDPDNNFYNNLNNTCEYYTEEQYKQVKMDGHFSIIHF